MTTIRRDEFLRTRAFRVSSKDGDFEGVLEVTDLAEVPVARGCYDYTGEDCPDHEYGARVVRCRVTRVDPELAEFGDAMLDGLRQAKSGDPVVIAKFGPKYELHCLDGGYDAGVRYALEEL